MKARRVEIIWLDSAKFKVPPSYHWRKDAKRLAKRGCLQHVSLGYLVAQTKDCYLLAGTLNRGQMSELHGIPRGCVQSIRRLR